jgi:hypothetical protein
LLTENFCECVAEPVQSQEKQRKSVFPAVKKQPVSKPSAEVMRVIPELQGCFASNPLKNQRNALLHAEGLADRRARYPHDLGPQGAFLLDQGGVIGRTTQQRHGAFDA